MQAVEVRGAGPGAQHQRATSLHQLDNQLFIKLQGDSGTLQYFVLGIGCGDPVHEFVIGPGKLAALADVQGLPDQTEGDHRFTARFAGQPMVCVGTRQGLKGAHLKKKIFAAVAMGMHLFKFAGIFNRRQPGFQEIGAE